MAVTVTSARRGAVQGDGVPGGDPQELGQLLGQNDAVVAWGDGFSTDPLPEVDKGGEFRPVGHREEGGVHRLALADGVQGGLVDKEEVVHAALLL